MKKAGSPGFFHGATVLQFIVIATAWAGRGLWNTLGGGAFSPRSGTRVARNNMQCDPLMDFYGSPAKIRLIRPLENRAAIFK
jgi:hypothetical protein